MVTSAEPLRIAIVGGGIGGLTLAVMLSPALSQPNPPFTLKLYEASAAFQEIGAGVGFGPNALKALQRTGLGEEYSRRADTTVKNRGEKSVWFEYRKGVKLEENDKEGELWNEVFTEPEGHSSIHRAEFLDLLVSRLHPSVAVFSKRLVSLHSPSQGQAATRLSFLDGTSAEADLVIGADGIKSVVRKWMYQGVEGGRYVDPQFTGTSAYRGMVPMEKAVKHLGEQCRKVPQIYSAPSKHVLTFPIQQFNTLNIVAFLTDRSAAVNSHTSVDEAPSSTGAVAWPGGPWVTQITKEELLKAYDGYGEGVLALLSEIEQPSKWGLHELESLPSYVKDNVVLMGDAAHGMLPHQGAGAGQALEDGYILSVLLTTSPLPPVTSILAIYDTLRRRRGNEVKEKSRAVGDIYQLQGGKESWKLYAERLKGWFKYLWEYDVDEAADEAKRLCREQTRLVKKPIC
ncbi:FAD/NAD(P)-binding domain-containing protein [Atractiella rhizophila]|nr:FAD/NAD(P)-binding domain-containing protein [Atractiella rhizophila]